MLAYPNRSRAHLACNGRVVDGLVIEAPDALYQVKR
jgi:hypothetical protein